MNQQIRKGKESPASILRIALATIFLLWMVMGSFPTGWIYDIGARTGVEPGQRPDQSVVQVTQKDEIHTFAQQKTPVTVSSDTLILTPLMRLRDLSEAGIHKTNRETGYQHVEVKAYHKFNFPLTGRQKILKPLVLDGSYNSYYLAQLKDGTYIGVFFDDYQMIGKSSQKKLSLPAGQIRYGTGEERSMLNKMAADYEVNTSYVLDMYGDSKIWWGFDKLLRLIVAMGILFVLILLRDRFLKKGESKVQDAAVQ